MLALLQALWTRVGLYAVGALAIAGVLLGAKRAGRQEAKAEAGEQALSNVKARADVEIQVKRAGGSDAVDQLRRDWRRG